MTDWRRMTGGEWKQSDEDKNADVPAKASWYDRVLTKVYGVVDWEKHVVDQDRADLKARFVAVDGLLFCVRLLLRFRVPVTRYA